MNKLTIDRPWGKFDQFTLNEESTVKILTLEPNSMLSLQYHNRRHEFWRVIDGRARVVIGDETFEAQADDEFTIPQKVKHRIITQNSQVRFLEISFVLSVEPPSKARISILFLG